MGKTIDMIGKKFGRLTVLERAPRLKRYNAMWRCQCKCGATVITEGSRMRRGLTISCGCYRRELITVHGLSNIPEYHVWKAMIKRCHNENDKDYKNYGGRGIAVCDTWRDSIVNFIADMGRRPSDELSIDRINNGGNYEPGNCKWATIFEQGKNKRPKTIAGDTYVTWNKCARQFQVAIRGKYIGLRKTLAEAIVLRDSTVLNSQATGDKP